DEDKQQYRLARSEELQTLIDVFRERVSKYPTDLRMKAKLGEALFRTRQYDEAIPVLQAAQNDPRSRTKCQLMIGRAFMETGNPQQAVEVLAEAISHHDRDDDVACELLYNQGLALETCGRTDDARAALGRVVRI